MPLMQLSTLVLPAPFGPISANSSPPSTANDTLSRTTRPPKRSERLSTVSSAIPPPAAPILLDRAIASPLAARLAEVELLDLTVIAQPPAIALQHDAAVFQHVAVIGDGKCHRGVLLDDDDGDTEVAADVDQPLHQVFDHNGRQAERK